MCGALDAVAKVGSDPPRLRWCSAPICSLRGTELLPHSGGRERWERLSRSIRRLIPALRPAAGAPPRTSLPWSARSGALLSALSDDHAEERVVARADDRPVEAVPVRAASGSSALCV